MSLYATLNLCRFGRYWTCGALALVVILLTGSTTDLHAAPFQKLVFSAESTFKVGIERTRTVQFRNPNTSSVTVLKLSFLSDGTTHLVDSSFGLPLVLAPGMSFTARVAGYSTDTVYAHNAKFTVIASFLGIPDTTSYVVTYRFVTEPGECVVATAEGVDQDHLFDDSIRVSVSLRNTEPFAVSVIGAAATGTGSDPISLDSSIFPITLAARDSTALQLWVHPTRVGSVSSIVAIPVDSRDSDNLPCAEATCTINKTRFTSFDYRDTLGARIASDDSLLFETGEALIGGHLYRILNNTREAKRIAWLEVRDTTFAIGRFYYSSDTAIAPSGSALLALVIRGYSARRSALVIHYTDSSLSREMPIVFRFMGGIASTPKPCALIVSPNPAGQLLHILAEQCATGDVELLDVLGNVVRRVRYEPHVVLNTSDLPRGHYFVRVSGRGIHSEYFTSTRSIVLR